MRVSDDFRRVLMRHGVFSYEDQATIWDIAVRCSKTMGVPLAGAGAVAGAGVGSVVVPGVGSIPGWVAGALAGWASGTAMCTVANASFRDELRSLLRD